MKDPDLQATDEDLIAELRQAFSRHEQWKSRSHARPHAGEPRFNEGRLGDYRFVRELGRGGMGVVYHAIQESSEQRVALKVLPASRSLDPDALRRFKAESQAAARVSHPNIVKVLGHGYDEGVFHFAMELVEGPGLDTIIQERRGGAKRTGWADWVELARLLAPLASGLEEVHAQGVVHRDLKPHNIIRGPDRLILTDFGLARVLDSPTMTVTGELLGTPVYRSPEQIERPKSLDHRTDIYSFGVLMYELLTGSRPFSGETPASILRSILDSEVKRPRVHDPSIPLDLEAVCLKAMARDPQKRYATAATLAADLQRFADGHRVQAARHGVIQIARRSLWRHRYQISAGVGLVVLLLLIVAWRASVSMGKAGEIDRLMEQSWDRLAFIDYRNPQVVADDVARAETLGAAGPKFDLLQGLLLAGMNDNDAAIRRLERVAGEVEADHVRSWVMWRVGRHAESTALLDSLLLPTSAEGWFFRGLALHRVRPEEAQTCYRNAISLRAANGDFFPQAMLHLARAQNQQLYATRDLEAVPEILRRLDQLVDHEVYGSYPHYLLSIAHRLAADAGDDPAQREEHLRLSMEWAERGETLDPTDDRPRAAKAECLERMGRLQDAIDTRTLVVHDARSEMARWEALHYRWRLRFWTGDGEGALADLAQCRALDDDNRFYGYLYPALVHAGEGEGDTALRLIDEMAAAASSADEVLWVATAYRLLCNGGRARAWLEGQPTRPDESWDAAMGLARGTPDQGDAASNRQVSRAERGARAFHLAALMLSDGDRAGCLEQLHDAHAAFDSELGYTYHARLLLGALPERLEEWPWDLSGLDIAVDR